MKYDIFISYRRDGGQATAQVIKDRLTALGYRVFFDVETLRNGDFNTRLYDVIEECSDFIVVLSEDGLDRCAQPDDWVRLELAHALKHNKNIVPVMLRGFSFPPTLPEEIDAVRYKNGLEANATFFDAFIEKLQSFLVVKTNIFRKTVRFIQQIRYAFISICIIVVVLLGGYFIYQQFNATYPRTVQQESVTGEVLVYMQSHLMVADTIVYNMQNAYVACETYLHTKDAAAYANAITSIETAQRNIEKQSLESIAINSSLEEQLISAPFNKADVTYLNYYLAEMQSAFLEDLILTKLLIAEDSYFSVDVQLEILALKQEYLSLFASEQVLASNMILLPIDLEYDSFVSFRNETLITFVNIPFDERAWITDETELERLIASNLEKTEAIVSEITLLVGEQNLLLMQDQQEFYDVLLALGYSEEDASAYIANISIQSAELTDAEVALETLQAELEAKYQEIREEYAPSAEDSADDLWVNGVRFLRINLLDEAIECFQAHLIKANGTYPDPTLYVPKVITFVNQIKNTGINYGAMIIAYDETLQTHDFYEIGDVIVAVNGERCENLNDYRSLIIDGEENVITVLRFDEDENFAFYEYIKSADSTQAVYMRTLAEG